MPPGLRWSLAILATVLPVPQPSEQREAGRVAHGRPAARRAARVRPRLERTSPCEIEVALVDADLLEALDEARDDRPDGARALAVARHVGPDEDRARAAPVGLGRAHRRADAEAPRLVARGGHDAAAARIAADHERLAPQLGPVELLDGGEERVEVEVRDHARRVRTGEVPAATASLPPKTARTAARRGSLTFSFDARVLELQRRSADALPGGPRAARASRARRRARASRSPPRRSGPPAGASGSGGHEAAHAQRGRALHGADVGELQTGRIVARDRERHALAAQRGDRHAHGAPALARDRGAERPLAGAQRDTRAAARAMPRIQTLTVAASLASRKSAGAQLERAGAGRQQGARRKSRGAARGAAHERHAGRDLLALPHAREIDRVRAPHHRVEHEPHVSARRVPPR